MRELDPWSLALEGTTLIEASAGTGKTYTLTTLYVRLLVEHGLTPDQILVVTYTQAATAELRTRVRERIQEALLVAELEAEGVDASQTELRTLGLKAKGMAARVGGFNPLRRALQDFDEAAIFTIHGFCQRALAQHAFESGVAFDAELVENAEVIERTLAHDLWARLLAGEDDAFKEWLERGLGRRWKFEPGELERKLIRGLGADEEMPVLPEVLEAPEDPARLGKAVEDAWSKWRAAWEEGGERAGTLLLEDGGLSRNKYRVATISGNWLPTLAQLAATFDEAEGLSEMLATPLPDFWAKLTPAGLLDGVKKGKNPPEDPFFDVCEVLGEAHRALAESYDVRALALRRRFVDAVREEAAIRREEKHLLFFDDLLSALRSALRAGSGDRLADLLRAQYPFALIDEFQDTDPVQYEIFETVWHQRPEAAGPGSLVLIGDPKQAIYSFRGADIFTYLRAGKDAGEAVFNLGKNWRSTPGLIAAVNALFEGPADVFGIGEIGFHPVAPRPNAERGWSAPGRSESGMRVLYAGIEAAAEVTGEELGKTLPTRFGRRQLMQAMARDVADLLDSGATVGERPVRPSDVAILCRRKVELQAARRSLESLGIPCVDRGTADVFDTRESWEILSVLQAFLRPGDPRMVRAALSTAAHGLDAEALARLEDDSPALVAIAERFAEYGRIWTQSGFSRAFESWRNGEGVSSRLLGLRDGERRLTNWLHLGELLQSVATDRIFSRAGLVAWLERAIADEDARAEAGSEASLLRLETDDEAVSLVTLHRSKGLEYEFVYLPSLWEDFGSKDVSVQAAGDSTKEHPPIRFHDHATGRRTLDLGLQGPDADSGYIRHVEQFHEEVFSEQLRLLYVGLTRAKRQCVIAWGRFGKGFMKAPLSWLLHGRAYQALCASEGKAQTRSGFMKWMKDEVDDEGMRSAWTELMEATGHEALAVEEANFEPRERWQPPFEARAELSFEPPKRVPTGAVRTTSFSGLVRDEHRSFAASGPALIGRDLDAEVTSEELPANPEAPDLAGEMHSFPRGAEAGTLLHEVLERVVFSDLNASDVRAVAAEQIERAGFDAECEDQILHVVESVATTPLRSDPSLLSLEQIAPDQFLPEMEFTLSGLSGTGTRRGTGAGDRGQGLSPSSLAALLFDAPEGSPLRAYAPRVASMSWKTLNGYLRGFIDAIFFDGERYYLVDYKSNDLGVHQADYMPPELLQPMMEHDYILQYLLYAVALDRYLGTCLPDYQYDTHFGGAYYLFLRGFSPSHAEGCGVFFDRPSGDLIQRISILLSAPEESAA
ncbi:MAG: exodeoxyribonuclease V subunit beta [Myxococcota bacterium]